MFCSIRTVLFNLNVNMNCFVVSRYKNKNCSVCNIKLDVNNYNKDRTVCKDCYKRKKRKNSLVQNAITISHQQPKIENGNNNNNDRTLFVGPSFSGKTYLMLKTLHEYQIEIFIQSLNHLQNSIPLLKPKLKK